jgi:transcriptional regulator with XRE-family HTH domain
MARRVDIAFMRRRNRERTTSTFGVQLTYFRHGQNLSRRQLSAASGLRRHTIASLERDRRQPSPDETRLLRDALGVEFDLEASHEPFSLVVGKSSEGEIAHVEGDHALDALLREYLSMVAELRSCEGGEISSLRHDDLTELARVLGGTPEAIESRLMALLGMDASAAFDLRSVIAPSLTAAPADRRVS